jgi:hypothetical protein
MNPLRDAYLIDCVVLATLSLIAVWRSNMLATLLFVKKDQSQRAETALRFIALVCASGAIVAILLRIMQKGG